MSTRAIVNFGSQSFLAECGTPQSFATIVSSPTPGPWAPFAARCQAVGSGTANFNVWNVSPSTGVPNYNESAGQTSYVKFAFRADVLPSLGQEFIFRLADIRAAAKFGLAVMSDGNLNAIEGYSTLIATTSGAVVQLGVWHTVEVKVGSGPNAAVEVKLDGTVILSTTHSLSSNDGGQSIFGKSLNFGSNDVDFYYGDIVVSDSAYPGAVKTALVKPDAAGACQDFAVGAGSGQHWQVAANLPPNFSTSYLVSTAQGQAETEGLEPVSGFASAILAVRPVSVLRRNSSNTTAKGRLVSGGNVYDLSAAAVGSSVASVGAVYDTDPATGSAWNPSDVDGIEVGAVDVHATNRVRMASAFAVVAFS